MPTLPQNASWVTEKGTNLGTALTSLSMCWKYELKNDDQSDFRNTMLLRFSHAHESPGILSSAGFNSIILGWVLRFCVCVSFYGMISKEMVNDRTLLDKSVDDLRWGRPLLNTRHFLRYSQSISIFKVID